MSEKKQIYDEAIKSLESGAEHVKIGVQRLCDLGDMLALEVNLEDCIRVELPDIPLVRARKIIKMAESRKANQLDFQGTLKQLGFFGESSSVESHDPISAMVSVVGLFKRVTGKLSQALKEKPVSQFTAAERSAWKNELKPFVELYEELDKP